MQLFEVARFDIEGPIVGANNATVRRDLSPVGNPTPEITGRDGKTYPPKPDVIEVTSDRRPRHAR